MPGWLSALTRGGVSGQRGVSAIGRSLVSGAGTGATWSPPSPSLQEEPIMHSALPDSQDPIVLEKAAVNQSLSGQVEEAQGGTVNDIKTETLEDDWKRQGVSPFLPPSIEKGKKACWYASGFYRNVISEKKTKSVWVQPWDTSQPYLQPPTCSATLLFITIIIILAVIVIISYSHNTVFQAFFGNAWIKIGKKIYNLLFSLTYSNNKRQTAMWTFKLRCYLGFLNLPSETDRTWCFKTIVASDLRSCKRKPFPTMIWSSSYQNNWSRSRCFFFFLFGVNLRRWHWWHQKLSFMNLTAHQ